MWISDGYHKPISSNLADTSNQGPYNHCIDCLQTSRVRTIDGQMVVILTDVQVLRVQVQVARRQSVAFHADVGRSRGAIAGLVRARR